MGRTWYDEVKSWAGGIIRRVCNHYYGCCDEWWRNCSRCKYVKKGE